MRGGPVMLPLQLKLALKSGCGVPLHLATHLWYSASCFISLWSPSSLDTILSASPLHPHFVQLGSLSLAFATSLPLLWRFSCPTHVPALVLSHCSQQQSRAGCVSWWDASPADPPLSAGLLCLLLRLPGTQAGRSRDTLQSAQTALPTVLSTEEQVKFCKRTGLEQNKWLGLGGRHVSPLLL